MKLLKNPLLLLTWFFFLMAVLVVVYGLTSYFNHVKPSSITETKANTISAKGGSKLTAELSKNPVNVVNSNVGQNDIGGVSLEGICTLMLVLIALATLTYQAYRNNVDDNQKNSKFYLKNYKQTSEIILKHLRSDTPTRRTSWISAASIADKLISLENKITCDADREILEIHQRNFAHDIHEFFFNKSAMYFTGKDQAQSWGEAFKKPEIIASQGLISNIPLISYINKKTIKSILNITNPIWDKESGYKYSNEEQFKNVVNFNYPELGKYLEELDRRKL